MSLPQMISADKVFYPCGGRQGEFFWSGWCNEERLHNEFVMLGLEAPQGPKSNTAFHMPARWNLEAKRRGLRLRVFCDLGPVAKEHHSRKIQVLKGIEKQIRQTQRLDWFLYTNRPSVCQLLFTGCKRWPRNVCIGCSVQGEKDLRSRLLPLLKIKTATARYVIIEELPWCLDLSNVCQTKGLYPLNAVYIGMEGQVMSAGERIRAADIQRQAKEIGAVFLFREHFDPACEPLFGSVGQIELSSTLANKVDPAEARIASFLLGGL